jgi:hypothetical protein
MKSEKERRKEGRKGIRTKEEAKRLRKKNIRNKNGLKRETNEQRKFIE